MAAVSWSGRAWAKSGCLFAGLVVSATAQAGQEALTENPPPGTPQEVTLGLAGISASAVYAYGWPAVNPSTGGALPNQHGLDLTLDYRVQKGVLKGLWFRVQRLLVRAIGEAAPSNEWQLILNWEIPLT